MDKVDKVYTLRLSNNIEIGNTIQELYTNYSMAENKLYMQMALNGSNKTVEENRENIIEIITDVEYRLRLLKDYLYNCSLIDDDILMN